MTTHPFPRAFAALAVAILLGACGATSASTAECDDPVEHAEALAVGAMQRAVPLTPPGPDTPVDWVFATAPSVPEGEAGERADLYVHNHSQVFLSPLLVDPATDEPVRTLTVVYCTLRSVALAHQSSIMRTVPADGSEPVVLSFGPLQRTRPAEWHGDSAVMPEDDPYADDPRFDLALELAPAEGLTWGEVRGQTQLAMTLTADVD